MSRLVLIDRDGTINVEKHYLSSPSEIELFRHTGDAIKLLKSLGLTVAIITNQSGVGRGYMDLAMLEAIHDRLRELLQESGAAVDAVYVCPHTLQNRCRCRKPAAEMAFRAAADFGANLREAFVIGDKDCDIELGKNIRATTVLVLTGYGAKTASEENTKPDYVVENLFEAANLIKGIIETNDANTAERQA